MTYREALDLLGRQRRIGMKLGLEKMEALAAALGSPQRKLRFLHIAGTNGKGSTAAFCDAALRRRGLRCGLFTSPHLTSVRERIRIGGQLISPEAFARAFAVVWDAAHRLPAGLGEPTFFEILTAMALLHFAESEVDWVVWETGLGGRLDSTNIVTPDVAIIPHIGLDHAEFLGPDLASIATEKAGIIKPGVPVVTAVQEPKPLDVLRRVAAERGAPLVEVDREFPCAAFGVEGGRQLARIGGEAYALSLLGAHQARNAACAAAALLRIAPFSHTELASAFAHTSWPGRFQIVRHDPPLVIDGGHNPDGIAAAATAWRALYGDTPCHLVYGTLADKDAARAARLLAPLACRVSLVRPTSDRAVDPAALVPLFAPLPTDCHDSLARLWPELKAAPLPTLVIGSLVLAGDALRLEGEAEEDDVQLNELLSPAP